MALLMGLLDSTAVESVVSPLTIANVCEILETFYKRMQNAFLHVPLGAAEK